jgi:regulator of protease activity HflC (stomatin/prohibitin superfamily)
MISVVCLTETKQPMEMQLTPLEGELQNISVAGGRSDVTPMMATRSATVDMSVKWRLNPRKRFVFSSSIPQTLLLLFNGVFGGSSIKILHVRIK